MRVNANRLHSAARAFTCAASLLLTTLAQGCAQTTDTNGGRASAALAPTQAATVAPTAQPTASAAPSPGVQTTGNPLPAPTGFVNDFAEVLDAAARARLEETLQRLRERAKVVLVVMTVETTGGRDIKDYSLAVARGWGVGPPAGEEGGGLFLLLATGDRKWQIRVSRSLEADLPDDVTTRIGERMIPGLRAAQYAEALGACVEGLVERLAERRGLSRQDVQYILQAAPEATPKPAKSKGAARAKT